MFRFYYSSRGQAPCSSSLNLHRISERQSMVCTPVWRDNPQASVRGLSTVQAHKPWSLSVVP